MPTRDHPITESVDELGGGFRRLGLAKFTTDGFESVYHGDYLYFRDRRVSYFASSSLAPSRAFAAYADLDFESQWRHDQYGFHVYIFGAADQNISRVTSEPLYYQGEFTWEWHESERYVVLRFKDGRATRLQLPPDKA